MFEARPTIPAPARPQHRSRSQALIAQIVDRLEAVRKAETNATPFGILREAPGAAQDRRCMKQARGLRGQRGEWSPRPRAQGTRPRSRARRRELQRSAGFGAPSATKHRRARGLRCTQSHRLPDPPGRAGGAFRHDLKVRQAASSAGGAASASPIKPNRMNEKIEPCSGLGQRYNKVSYHHRSVERVARRLRAAQQRAVRRRGARIRRSPAKISTATRLSRWIEYDVNTRIRPRDAASRDRLTA